MRSCDLIGNEVRRFYPDECESQRVRRELAQEIYLRLISRSSTTNETLKYQSEAFSLMSFAMADVFLEVADKGK